MPHHLGGARRGQPAHAIRPGRPSAQGSGRCPNRKKRPPMSSDSDSRTAEPRYFLDPDGETFMLHRPDEAQVEAMVAMGAREIGAEEYRELEKERMGTEEGPPTGGYGDA